MKTSELTGAALDWAVAKCEGVKVEKIMELSLWSSANWHKYSTNWAQGGPIIEREQLHVSPEFWIGDGWHWVAYVLGPGNLDENFEQRGPTPLIAAMRCYVASKLGDEVEIPEELT
jgi:hypothetical protein